MTNTINERIAEVFFTCLPGSRLVSIKTAGIAKRNPNAVRGDIRADNICPNNGGLGESNCSRSGPNPVKYLIVGEERGGTFQRGSIE